MFVHRCLNGTAPQYVAEHCVPVSDCLKIASRVVNGYSINRLTGPEGRTGPETDGPFNRRIIHYLAITSHVYKFWFMNIVPPLIFSFRLHFCSKAATTNHSTTKVNKPLVQLNAITKYFFHNYKQTPALNIGGYDATASRYLVSR